MERPPALLLLPRESHRALLYPLSSLSFFLPPYIPSSGRQRRTLQPPRGAAWKPTCSNSIGIDRASAETHLRKCAFRAQALRAVGQPIIVVTGRFSKSYEKNSHRKNSHHKVPHQLPIDTTARRPQEIYRYHSETTVRIPMLESNPSKQQRATPGLAYRHDSC